MQPTQRLISLAYITPRSNAVLPEYLYRAFVAAYSELRRISEASGSTKGALTCWDIAHFKVPVPPPREQQGIENQICRDTDCLEITIGSIRRQIEFLNEYRIRLFADVVTGKLDVRQAAADLTAEPEEMHPFQELAPEAEDEVDDSVQDADHAEASDADE